MKEWSNDWMINEVMNEWSCEVMNELGNEAMSEWSNEKMG